MAAACQSLRYEKKHLNETWPKDMRIYWGLLYNSRRHSGRAAHEVRQRARCHNFGVKGNNTYQIVYTGNSDIAMDGAGVRSADMNQPHEILQK